MRNFFWSEVITLYSEVYFFEPGTEGIFLLVYSMTWQMLTYYMGAVNTSMLNYFFGYLTALLCCDDLLIIFHIKYCERRNIFLSITYLTRAFFESYHDTTNLYQNGHSSLKRASITVISLLYLGGVRMAVLHRVKSTIPWFLEQDPLLFFFSFFHSFPLLWSLRYATLVI